MRTRDFMRWITALMLVMIVIPASAQYGSRGDQRYRDRYGRSNTYGDVVNLRLDNPGTLEEMMPADMKERVRLLHIEGPLDSRDFAYLKKLCNRSRCVDRENHKIDNYIDLELENANILSASSNVRSNSSRSERDVLGDALSGSHHLRSIVLPQNLKQIGDRALKNCGELEEVIMPPGVRSLGNEAFSNCTRLEYIKLRQDLERIGEECFYDCSNLQGIGLPHSLTEIGNRAFMGSGIKEVVLPDRLRSLGSCAFEGTPLTLLEIPAATRIVDNKIGMMKNLREIRVADGNEYYSVSDGVLYDGRGSMLLFCPVARTGALTVPDGVTQIAEYALSGTAISSVSLPRTLREIGSHAFSECSKLSYVDMGPSVQTIGESAFENCSSLAAISLPNDMKKIAPLAFKKCTSLASVTLPAHLTEIGKEAFEKCSSLMSIDLPYSLTTISERAFKDCTGLTRVVVPDACTWVKKEAFLRCTGLMMIDLGNGLQRLGEHALQETAITQLVIPASVTRIDKEVTKKCSNLNRIECHAVNPPSLDKVSNEKIPLYVPASAIEAYKKAKNWKKFNKNIHPLY